MYWDNYEKKAFLDFQNASKPKKRRKTTSDMSPEQIEKARQLRMVWYRKNKGKVLTIPEKNITMILVIGKELQIINESGTFHQDLMQ